MWTHLVRKAGSSSRRLRIHEVTSECHLLALQERQAGTTFVRVYRPPREMGSTQSFWSADSCVPQYAQPPHAPTIRRH